MPGSTNNGGSGIDCQDDLLSLSDTIATRIPIVGMPPGMQLSYRGIPVPAVKAAEMMLYRACVAQHAAGAQEAVRRWQTSQEPVCKLYRAIRKMKLPQMKRVTAENSPEDSTGICLGMSTGLGRRAVVKGMPSGAKEVKLASEVMQIDDKNFTFTSLQLVVNARAQVHVDKGNVGQSLGLALGPFKGGDLCVHEGDENSFRVGSPEVVEEFDGRKAHFI